VVVVVVPVIEPVAANTEKKDTLKEITRSDANIFFIK
jgi:hypothetical protein